MRIEIIASENKWLQPTGVWITKNQSLNDAPLDSGALHPSAPSAPVGSICSSWTCIHLGDAQDVTDNFINQRKAIVWPLGTQAKLTEFGWFRSLVGRLDVYDG